MIPVALSQLLSGAEFQVNTYTTSNQYEPSIAALNDGSFIVTWTSFGQDDQNDGYSGIYAQRYDANGDASGAEFQVNTYTTSNQSGSSIATLSNGGFVVTWQSYGQVYRDMYGVYAQRYDANGKASGAELEIARSATSNTKMQPSTAALSDGGFVVTWAYTHNSSIAAQRYDANGNAIGAKLQVNTNNYSSTSTTALSDGGFVVTWNTNDQWDIYAQRYNANGAASGAEFQVNTYTTNVQGNSSTTALSDGGFVVTWQSMGQDEQTSAGTQWRYLRPTL